MVERLCRIEIRIDIQTSDSSYSDEFDNIREADQYIDEILGEVTDEYPSMVEIRVDIQTNYSSYSDEFDDIRDADEYVVEIMKDVLC